MSDNLKLYVRGFLGSANMSTESIETPRSRPILSVFDFDPKALKHVVLNESIVEVYNMMVRRQVIHTDFDFRERVIKIALTAFGVDNFNIWAMANTKSPTFTQTHADFISDTARFIVTGKRHMPINMWEHLVTPGVNDPTTDSFYDESLLKAMPVGWSARHCQRTQYNIHNVVAQWLTHNGGFTDMVTSLYTFFGECDRNPSPAFGAIDGRPH
jgi:hypothetical protein